ncbi:UDP-N-acetylmuramoyl-L-alanyl-D-glutamate--L-lysine ligase [Clostridium homopropionicum DSM 5847]|uniref:UDP-N-acetylmuramoyl-L-alanyl-D-glutamate--2,6-diaminopimelate ligase n=1 Tax=Clostridium homopropionicum DSM 5847 TaxID=1121318 RepID=A0A0L6ZDC6_9CLOT|nr:UDP-N-acetylmuramoyl-L-alanyl-D-glutamate--2,6-diaminopimelate ligase [Clostridium homopropionicum]KOA20981.1 UDP-N-acetylmuramoyl-L-alanyl-D-glutamate--L-lysine ligase [Clostridium homopropionicum DSM 5847]SFG00383.1 UDP-N-acetylmuramoylalanyl-D-glutamate--2,6-diaminopimelate ligase [Clostridium homopropionicum]
MRLSVLLKKINYQLIKGDLELEVNSIQYDSRKVREGDLFVCIEGFNSDGHKYAYKAVENGAKVVICTKELDKSLMATIIKVDDSRKALASIASEFYGNPADTLKLIGITGTNGKTTSSYMIRSILESVGYKTGLIGTIANYIGNEKLKAERTTPESLELHELFSQMVKQNVNYAIMEVSSHSLSLNRVYGIEFSESIFTNLTQDHLDFHKTFENYFQAKLILFKNSKNSIINIDDIYGQRITNELNNKNILSYSTEASGDLMAKNIINHSRGAEFDLFYKGESVHIKLSIPGKYNVYNALGSAGVCINEGISLDKIKEGLENVVVPGRCEIVSRAYDVDFDIIIDYAHTPDGLENILNTAREFTRKKLICVFGCGGDRDKTKRPLMGEIASRLSDFSIVTSDNPRTEEPLKIIDDILAGIHNSNYSVIENRKDAIKEAIKIAKPGDVIVIAGKGHEDYQILKNEVIHFDEREVVAEIMKELF